MNSQKMIKRSPLYLLGLLGLTLFVSSVAAQVFDSGPSEPNLFDNVINLPPDPDIGNFQHIGGDGLTTQLNVSDGSALGESFNALSGGEVNISGGYADFLFHANSGSEVNISGGTVDSSFNAESGSAVNISGGSVGDFFEAFDGSLVNISGGSVGEHFDAESGSVVNISGGSTGNFFLAFSESVVNISGGTIGDIFVSLSGSVVNISGGTVGILVADSNSEINLFGSDFVLDGESLTDSLTHSDAFTIDRRDDVTLTGLLADGSPFSFHLNSSFVFGEDEFAPDATLTVTLASPVLRGDCNLDGEVDFLDINPFIAALASASLLEQADCNQDGVVNFFDITPFVAILSGS